MIFSELMGSESLFLTANADTVYYLSFIDLSSGPMVVETPPQALAIFDDMAFNWMVDFGLAGPDRGEGGKFLLLPPGYEGDLPDAGFYLGRSRTVRALALGRSFMQDSDPKPTADLIKRTMKIYPYTPGAYGTPIATLLEGTGQARQGREDPRDHLRRGKRQGVQHDPVHRCTLLRPGERGGPAGAARVPRSRDHGSVRGDRDR